MTVKGKETAFVVKRKLLKCSYEMSLLHRNSQAGIFLPIMLCMQIHYKPLGVSQSPHASVWPGHQNHGIISVLPPNCSTIWYACVVKISQQGCTAVTRGSLGYQANPIKSGVSNTVCITLVQRGLFIAAVRVLCAQGFSFTPDQGPWQIHHPFHMLSSLGARPLRAPVF